jgi:phosphoribosylaminoimidazole carboxylase (NCAIR synthetase)
MHFRNNLFEYRTVNVSQISCTLTAHSHPTKICELAAKADVLTVEIEQIRVDVLEEVGVEVHPALSMIRTIQDKLQQKVHLQSHAIPVAPFIEIVETSVQRAQRSCRAPRPAVNARKQDVDLRRARKLHPL